MSPVRVAVLAFDGGSLFHLTVPGLVFGANSRSSGDPSYESGTAP
jgi:hypothetical protein